MFLQQKFGSSRVPLKIAFKVPTEVVSLRRERIFSVVTMERIASWILFQHSSNQGTLTLILKREGSLTGFTSCPYRIYLLGISWISAGRIFLQNQNNPIHTGQLYVILPLKKLCSNPISNIIEQLN